MAAKDLDQLVSELRSGDIDASEFKEQLNEVVGDSEKAGDPMKSDPGRSERIDDAARRASRL